MFRDIVVGWAAIMVFVYWNRIGPFLDALLTWRPYCG